MQLNRSEFKVLICELNNRAIDQRIMKSDQISKIVDRYSSIQKKTTFAGLLTVTGCNSFDFPDKS